MKQRENFATHGHFKQNETLTRVLYGEKHITMEVLHTVCDGRALQKVISALLVRYYELLGYQVNKEGMINCTDQPKVAEVEDAYEKYADLRKTKPKKVNKEAYVPKYQPDELKTMSHRFDLTQMKTKAKTHGATITEYIIAHMMNEIAKQRAKENCQKAIVVAVPIDCRSFFPTETLLNFNSGQFVVMPENSTFIEKIQAARTQFNKINADFLQELMSQMENLKQLAKYVPLAIKKPLIRKIGMGTTGSNSALLSSLGVMKLPAEIQDKVDMFTFAIAKNPYLPYEFGCVTMGNTLTLTTITTAKDTELIENIFLALTDGKV